ncbi:MAG: hypothetical protein Q4P66_00695 [Actinomycetaceae bacterium]|nr:hypothetical protein [Actinomycetaceae bacterium]
MPQNIMVMLVTLILLGLGWSASLVAGSALITASLSNEHRVLAQGFSDSGISVKSAIGAGLSGPVLAWLGFRGRSSTHGKILSQELSRQIYKM